MQLRKSQKLNLSTNSHLNSYNNLFINKSNIKYRAGDNVYK
jgi:hypothetical protein